MSTAAAALGDRDARLALGAVTDAGEPSVSALVAAVGPAAAWEAVLEGGLGELVAARARHLDLDQEREAYGTSDARFVVPGDEEWPDRLDDLAEVDAVQRRGGVPLGLWLRGPGHLRTLVERSVAVVGSRAATAYGNGVAADLASDLADAGVTVVSGGAFGIDAAAHRGALAVGGPTVGVVANGVDVAYPPGNARIFEGLAARHLVVSELPPGSHPTRVRFLARNRLIAALTLGTVVVEAALRSGARNTAGWASSLGRTLMAVPGPVHSAASVGPHLMVRQGQAVLVTRADEVLELVSAAGEHLLGHEQGPDRRTDALDVAQLGVFEALSARRWRTPGEIASTAGVRVPVCLAALTELESRGLAVGDARGWRATPRGPA
ncbi:DNA processing protein [Microlunatus sagamiharensis]|uniref:DNA processing protein n=1 Tax=Microlunatus sagamiharensis TaxID=546874 RepID=A0A1H2LX68_9ACTN|nr:DNA-processing protein DprA [Microlunatus sagamiharensis]SDU84896.1 DNA processing protein [Microlunatus sagamiharensis]